MIHAKMSSIIFLAISLYCVGVNSQPLANCNSPVIELENYMLNDIKNILPSERVFWASGVNTSMITEGRMILDKIEKCSTDIDFDDNYRRLQDTYDLMLFYLNQIAEDAWYMKIVTSFVFKEEVFIRDYNEVMSLIATLKPKKHAE